MNENDSAPPMQELIESVWLKNIWDQARRYLLHCLIIIIVASLLSYWTFGWLVELSSAASAANGLVLSIWGIFLSIAGFAVTIWQLSRTKIATEAATEAVAKLKSRSAVFDANVEMQRAISFVRETQRHLRVESWDGAIASYSGTRESVLRLRELSGGISAEDNETIASMLADLATISDRIETGLVKKSVAIDRGRALRGCRDHEDFLIKLSISFQKEIR